MNFAFESLSVIKDAIEKFSSLIYLFVHDLYEKDFIGFLVVVGLAIGWAFMGLFTIYLFWFLPKWKRGVESKDEKREVENEVCKGNYVMPKDREIADRLSDAIDKMVEDDLLSVKEAQKWRKWLGEELQVHDLIPRDLKGLKRSLVNKRLEAGLPLPVSIVDKLK